MCIEASFRNFLLMKNCFCSFHLLWSFSKEKKSFYFFRSYSIGLPLFSTGPSPAPGCPFSHVSSSLLKDGNGYLRPKTRWIFTLLGHGCGLKSLPMGILMDKKPYMGVGVVLYHSNPQTHGHMSAHQNSPTIAQSMPYKREMQPALT